MKARYWVAIMYLENMIDDWRDVIGDKLQVPYAYCIHDKDKDKNGDIRKPHVHIIIAYGNTTTQKAALKVFKRLEKPGYSAIPNDIIEDVTGIRNQYDYLIHDTEDSKKKGKYLYDKSERITGNGFDIGSYEQLSAKEKNDMAKELCDVIIKQNITNFSDFYMMAVTEFDSEYFEVIKTYSGLFERITKGNYQKMVSHVDPQ